MGSLVILFYRMENKKCAYHNASRCLCFSNTEAFPILRTLALTISAEISRFRILGLKGGMHRKTYLLDALRYCRFERVIHVEGRLPQRVYA